MLRKEWFTAAELAALALPGMPATQMGVHKRALRERWQEPEKEGRRWRRRCASGGGVEYHYSVLPSAAQARLAMEFAAVEERAERDAARAALSAGELWAWFDRLPEAKKAKARERLETLDAVEALVRSGVGKVVAMQQIAALRGVALANRYRFKVREDEPHGVMTQLGVQVHWTAPYSGQSKPIERAFRDFAQGLAKHPAFAGAWTGNDPTAKPENYASRAVSLDTFLQVVAEGIAEHNTRPGRRGGVFTNGRSFQQAFEASYARAPIRRATAEQRRLWLMAAEAVMVRRADASIHLEGNRYWADFLLQLRGQRVCVRFDPQALQEDLHVYRLDGAYLGAAPCVEAVGFADVEAAREHARRRRAWLKGYRQMAEAEVRMSIDQVAAMLPQAAPEPPAPPPAPRVVRLVQGSAALKPAPTAEEEEDETPPDERLFVAAVRELRAGRSGPQLRIVADEEADAEV